MINYFNSMDISDKISLIGVAISIIFGIASLVVSIIAIKRTGKQQKLDEYKLKIDIYNSINKVFDYCQFLKQSDNWLNLLDYSAKQAKVINESFINNADLNERVISETLNNAKHLFEKDIANDIEEIRTKFLITVNCFKVLDADEKNQAFNKKAIETALDSIYYICKQQKKIIDELNENIKVV